MHAQIFGGCDGNGVYNDCFCRNSLGVFNDEFLKMASIIALSLAAFFAALLGSYFAQRVERHGTKDKIGVASVSSECWWVLKDALPRQKGAKEFFVLVVGADEAAPFKNLIKEDLLFFAETNNPALNSALLQIWRKKQKDFIGEVF